MPRRSIWKDSFVDAFLSKKSFLILERGMNKRREEESGSLEFGLLKMVFFLEGLFLYFMVSEPTRELGC